MLQHKKVECRTSHIALVNTYRTFSTSILDEESSVVEGLIIDPVAARVGSRNHTLPLLFDIDAEWSEDILFFEPETVCIDTNLSYETRLSPSYERYNSTEPGGYVVDHGGFYNINGTDPWLDGGWHIEGYDAQEDPKLAVRAYRAA